MTTHIQNALMPVMLLWCFFGQIYKTQLLPNSKLLTITAKRSSPE